MRSIDNDDIGAFSLAVVLLVAIEAWGGFVLSTMWGWYMVPILGVKPLGFFGAVGLLLMASLFHQPVPEVSTSRLISFFTIVPLVVLTLGWLLKPFIEVAA